MFVFIYLLLVAGSVAQTPELPTTPSPSDPDATWSLVEQEVLPKWHAREEVAALQVAARDRFVVGDATLSEAYPRLGTSTLGSSQLVRGRLATLTEREVTRSREATRSAPAGVTTEERLAIWRSARDAALTAEAQADQRERALCVSVLARLEDHPELRADRVKPLLEELEVVRGSPETLPADASEALRQAWSMEAAEADAAFARTHQWLTELRARGRVDASLFQTEVSELARGDNTLAARAAADRLVLLRRFLSGDARQSVDAALQTWFATPRSPASDPQTSDPAALEAMEARAAAVLQARERRAVVALTFAEDGVAGQLAHWEQETEQARAAYQALTEQRRIDAGLLTGEDGSVAAQAEAAARRAEKAEADAGDDEVRRELAQQVDGRQAAAAARFGEGGRSNSPRSRAGKRRLRGTPGTSRPRPKIYVSSTG